MPGLRLSSDLACKTDSCEPAGLNAAVYTMVFGTATKKLLLIQLLHSKGFLPGMRNRLWFSLHKAGQWQNIVFKEPLMAYTSYEYA